jgi:hypothetical protein
MATVAVIKPNLPKDHAELLADSHTPPHERLQPFVFERGENPAHKGEPGAGKSCD